MKTTKHDLAMMIVAERDEVARLQAALELIELRIHGDYDDPRLVAYGPLSGLSVDCSHIARAALKGEA